MGQFFTNVQYSVSRSKKVSFYYLVILQICEFHQKYVQYYLQKECFLFFLFSEVFRICDTAEYFWDAISSIKLALERVLIFTTILMKPRQSIAVIKMLIKKQVAVFLQYVEGDWP